MKKKDIIRAWRDGDYYASLTDEQRAALPESPAALMEVEDDVLSSITGGCSLPGWCPTSGFCTPCPPRECF